MTDTTKHESANLTAVWTKAISISGVGNKLVTMFTTGANDVWPAHPVDFNLK